MKDKTLGTFFWIAVGLAVLGLGIAKLWPIVTSSLNDVDGKKPAVPTSYVEQKFDGFTHDIEKRV